MKVFELFEAKEKFERKDDAQFRKDYARWKKLVNIPNTVLKTMLPTEEGRKTGLSDKDKRQAKSYRMTNSTARAIVRLRKTPLKDWTTADVNWMYRQLNFIDRYKKRDVPLEKNGKPTAALKNLWAWGHVPVGKRPAL